MNAEIGSTTSHHTDQNAQHSSSNTAERSKLDHVAQKMTLPKPAIFVRIGASLFLIRYIVVAFIEPHLPAYAQESAPTATIVSTVFLAIAELLLFLALAETTVIRYLKKKKRSKR
jgi:hypothetical protein